MLLVGLTGGISTGKSTVSRMLRESGIPVIDCDEIAKEVVRPGRWGWKRVVKAFGTDVLLENKAINRELLGELIFRDQRSRAKLNKATHLPVFLELVKRIIWAWLTCQTVLVVDMPLLFETGADRWFYPTIMVWCDEETQIMRLMDRDGVTVEEAAKRIAAQMPLEEKAEKSTVLIDNSGHLTSTKTEVKYLVFQMKKHQLTGYLSTPLALLMYSALSCYVLYIKFSNYSQSPVDS